MTYTDDRDLDNLEWLQCALLRKRRLLTIWYVTDDPRTVRIDNPAFDTYAFAYTAR